MCMCVHVIMLHHGLDKITVPSHVPKHKGMCQYIRAKFRNVTKDRTKQWGPVQECNYVSVFRNNF